MINRRKFIFATAASAVSGYSARLVTASTNASRSMVPDVQRFGNLITPEKLRSRLYFIASDLFEGRGVGTRGQQLAASYIGSEYAHLGFAPANPGSDPSLPESFFQRFPCYARIPKRAVLGVTLAAGKPLQASSVGTDTQLYFAGTDFRDVGAPAVFACYGIEDTNAGYQDYTALRERSISIDGKWVVILDGEPKFLAGADGKPSKWAASILEKRRALQVSGKAAGVLIVSNFAANSPEFQAQVTQAAHAGLGRAAGNGWRVDWPASSNPVTLVIARDLGEQIFKSINTSVKAVTDEIDRDRAPKSIDFPSTSIEASFEAFPQLESENVIAILEGSDPALRKEFVVISAHHDHLGIDPTTSGDHIYNGAADDGSGTVALLEMAAVFARAKAEGVGPRRSIVFLHTSGEEAGLLGSKYFVDEQPLISLDAIIADLNMDGIAGFDPNHPRHSQNYLYVIVQPDEMRGTVARAQKESGVTIELDPHPDFNSDHNSFWRHQVPFIYYSTGFVKNLHQPSDKASTIDYEHFARAARISFATAWELATQPAAIHHKPQASLNFVGYVCPPCGLDCDEKVYGSAGTCPICGMVLEKKFS
jgi:Zn-dependent M28 family amino/carboxypeptidase